MLYIFANCTSRKREPTPKQLRVRTIKTKNAKEKATLWWQRLSASHPVVAAEKMYSGEHWSIVQKTANTAQHLKMEPSLWILSAGYGLIQAASLIASYAATFQLDHPDTIAANAPPEERKALVQTWWSTLNSFSLGGLHEPRTITALAEKTPDAQLLFIASPEYLQAIEPDIIAAKQYLLSPEQLIIVSSRVSDELSAHLVPSEAPLQSSLGGSLLSLHARVALKIIKESNKHPLVASQLQKRYQQLIQASPPQKTYNRQKMTDAEVKAYIRKHLRKGTYSAHSPMHRALRDGGFACEQKRFKNLFEEVQNEKSR